MYCARNKRGFTLLEVMLAVMVMALIALSIYRFVTTGLDSIRISTEDTVQKRSVQALVSVLQEEFCNIPPNQQNPLLGEPHKFGGKRADEVQWITHAGNGLFTSAAEGLWQVRLALKPDDRGGSNTLGLVRKTPTSFDKTNNKGNWLPLLPNVDALEIDYYDHGHNNWDDTWKNGSALPTLVRVRIWRLGQPLPYEAVIELPPNALPS